MPGKTLILHADDIQDILYAMKHGESISYVLLDGTLVEIVGGDRETKKTGLEHSQVFDAAYDVNGERT